MKTLILLSLFLAFSSVSLADSGISVVFVQNNEIVISTEGAGQIELTQDGIPKDFPVWSKDGSKIAFIEKTGKNIALSRLVIIDLDGNPLSSFLIHPVPSDPLEVVSGMRFVEWVEWVTDSRIAVGGSINPSTCENIIFDLSTLQINDEFFDDGCNAAYSQDGLHVAYITGAPHFSPESARKRELDIDGRRVFPQRGTQVKFITDPKWSGDGQTLAIVATIEKTKTSHIVQWHAKGKLSVIPFPMKKEAFLEGKAELFWNGQDFIVTSNEQAWTLAQGRLNVIRPSHVVDPEHEAINIRMAQQASLKAGAKKPDFWCQSCPLSLLPRRSSVNAQ